MRIPEYRLFSIGSGNKRRQSSRLIHTKTYAFVFGICTTLLRMQKARTVVLCKDCQWDQFHELSNSLVGVCRGLKGWIRSLQRLFSLKNHTISKVHWPPSQNIHV